MLHQIPVAETFAVIAVPCGAVTPQHRQKLVRPSVSPRP